MKYWMKSVVVWKACVALLLVVGLTSNVYAGPQPDTARLMVVGAHPDDESIFYGGVLSYYASVREMDVISITMTNSGNAQRVSWLKTALNRAGLPNDPIITNFADTGWTATVRERGVNISDIDGVWMHWANWGGNFSGTDEQRIAKGKEKATFYLATQIRQYQIEVIAAHNVNGEYGHPNHVATSWAATWAFDIAGDDSIVLTDDQGNELPAWQPKKLYIHDYDYENGLRWPQPPEVAPPPLFLPGEPVPASGGGYEYADPTPLNKLYHEYFDIASDKLGGQTPSEVGGQMVADFGENLASWENNGRYTENWNLYKSTVGADTVGNNGQAHGDFFEHTTIDPFSIIGDVNLDGQLLGDGYGDPVIDDIAAFIAGWGHRQSAANIESWKKGDMNLDGRTNLKDWDLMIDAFPQMPAFSMDIPEPATCLLLGVMVSCYAGRQKRV